MNLRLLITQTFIKLKELNLIEKISTPIIVLYQELWGKTLIKFSSFLNIYSKKDFDNQTNT